MVASVEHDDEAALARRRPRAVARRRRCAGSCGAARLRLDDDAATSPASQAKALACGERRDARARCPLAEAESEMSATPRHSCASRRVASKASVTRVSARRPREPCGGARREDDRLLRFVERLASGAGSDRGGAGRNRVSIAAATKSSLSRIARQQAQIGLDADDLIVPQRAGEARARRFAILAQARRSWRSADRRRA